MLRKWEQALWSGHSWLLPAPWWPTLATDAFLHWGCSLILCHTWDRAVFEPETPESRVCETLVLVTHSRVFCLFGMQSSSSPFRFSWKFYSFCFVCFLSIQGRKCNFLPIMFVCFCPVYLKHPTLLFLLVLWQRDGKIEGRLNNSL